MGAFLQAARIKAGHTQREVSLILQYSSAQFISNFERGISLPPLEKLRILISLYKMDSDKLIRVIIDCHRDLMTEELQTRLAPAKRGSRQKNR